MTTVKNETRSTSDHYCPKSCVPYQPCYFAPGWNRSYFVSVFCFKVNEIVTAGIWNRLLDPSFATLHTHVVIAKRHHVRINGLRVILFFLFRIFKIYFSLRKQTTENQFSNSVDKYCPVKKDFKIDTQY